MDEQIDEQVDEQKLHGPWIVEKKYWRIYFTNRDFFPHLGAVDNGTIATQILVQWIEARNVVLIANTDIGKTKSEMLPIGVPGLYTGKTILRSDRKNKPNEPAWWMGCEAVAVFHDGGVELIGGE